MDLTSTKVDRDKLYGYFINGFMSGKYKKAVGLIARSKPELIVEFNQFITEI